MLHRFILSPPHCSSSDALPRIFVFRWIIVQYRGVAFPAAYKADDGGMCSQVMQRMRSTLFCLVLPGDSASARRTSEIFMAGCIPVFLGPPYGSMPLADAGGIDYKASSLFFNVSEYRFVPPNSKRP